MLNMQDEAASASPVLLGTPGNPAVEDWDVMMRALLQRIGTIAATSPAALPVAQRQDSLSDCGVALVQLGALLGLISTGPTARQQREQERKQATHLLARAWRAGGDADPKVSER